jgi:integrase
VYSALAAPVRGSKDWVQIAVTIPKAHLRVLDAEAQIFGLRRGQFLELLFLNRIGQPAIMRTDYRGYVGSPKGGRIRTLPLTRRLVSALKAMRHLRGDPVFSDRNGLRWSRCEADTRLRRAYRKAGLRKIGWHTLRHTFCSHLAMKGAPVRTIQELAGHATITTTMGYMHLTPSAARAAVDLLEKPNAVAAPWQHEGSGPGST